MGTSQFGINKKTIDSIVEEIKQVYDLGVGLAIVIGGGNIFRGVALGATGLERATADYMGMIATIMNAIALQDAMRQAKVEAKVQSAIRIDQIVEPYMRQKAMKYLNEKSCNLLRQVREILFLPRILRPHFEGQKLVS